MSDFTSLILILLPLFLGYVLPINKSMYAKTDTALRHVVLLLLLLLGIELAQVNNLLSQLWQIGLSVLLLIFLTIGFGLIGLMLYDKCQPWQRQFNHKSNIQILGIAGTAMQVGSVFVGMSLGHLIPESLLPPKDSVRYVLMLLLLLVGLSLKGSGIGLKTVLLNHRGVAISMIFTISVLFGGVVFAWLMPEVSLYQGLALASGFGWYSLSAGVIGDAYGAVWGSVALFNDLGREFFALMFIPLLMTHSPSAAIGSGGATSLDFTLPIIHQSGGKEAAALAVSFGFIINLLSPILMTVFAQLG